MEFDKAYFDAGIGRVGTDCEKWDGVMQETGDPDLIPMWVADMDFPSAPAIGQALADVLAWGTWGYTMCGERDAQALCDFWARQSMPCCLPSAPRSTGAASPRPGRRRCALRWRCLPAWACWR